MITVKFDTAEATKKLFLFPKEVEVGINNGLKKCAVAVEGSAKMEAPVGVSGHLRSGIKTHLIPFIAKVVPTVEYADDVHEGTPPHLITGSDFESLKNWASKKGVNVYAVRNSIKMYGTKANPFMERAVEKEQENFQDYFEQELTKVLLK